MLKQYIFKFIVLININSQFGAKDEKYATKRLRGEMVLLFE